MKEIPLNAVQEYWEWRYSSNYS